MRVAEMPISSAASRSAETASKALPSRVRALEELDQPHDGQHAHRTEISSGVTSTPRTWIGVGGDGGGEGAVVPPPDVLGGREEEEADDDGEQDPALALLLQRQPHAGPLHDQAQQRAEEQAAGHHQPVGQPQVDQGEAEEGRDHHQLALAEVDALAGGVGELEAVGDEGVDQPHERAAHGHLGDDRDRARDARAAGMKRRGGGRRLLPVRRGLLGGLRPWQAGPVGLVGEDHAAVLHHAHDRPARGGRPRGSSTLAGIPLACRASSRWR